MVACRSDRRDALRILLSLICDLKARSCEGGANHIQINAVNAKLNHLIPCNNSPSSGLGAARFACPLELGTWVPTVRATCLWHAALAEASGDIEQAATTIMVALLPKVDEKILADTAG